MATNAACHSCCSDLAALIPPPRCAGALSWEGVGVLWAWCLVVGGNGERERERERDGGGQSKARLGVGDECVLVKDGLWVWGVRCAPAACRSLGFYFLSFFFPAKVSE